MTARYPLVIDANGRMAELPSGDTLAGVSSGASVWVDTTAPSDPTAYPLWWKSDEGKLKVYYTDADSSQWVDATPVQPGPAAWGAPAAWVTATAYVVGPPASVVTNSGNTYVCLIAHTSGTFATDLAAGKWLLIAQVGGAGTTGPTGPAGPTGPVARIPPGGRLTLTTGVPVMTADATAQTSVYYTPYVHDQVPIYSGSAWTISAFTQLTLSLDTTNHLSGSVYDVFVWSNAGTVSIGTGPAWSSSTARGTGAGTTELQQLNGFWTNKNSITLKNGAGAGTAGIAANTATYVGTIYCTANGQTGMQFRPAAASGGSNNILGVWNAYNRVRFVTTVDDSGPAYAPAAAAVLVNGSTSNRVRWVDGLAQSPVYASINYRLAGGSGFLFIYLGLDIVTGGSTDNNFVNSTNNQVSVGGNQTFAPQLGFHFLQGLLVTNVSNGNLFPAEGGITATLEM